MKENKERTFGGDLLDFQVLTNIKALICSHLNLVIYIVIFLMVAGLDQGHAFQVAMFENGTAWERSWNILLFHSLLYYLAYIMSLYPTYIYTVLFSGELDESMGELKPCNKVIFKMSNLGLIYFEKKLEPKPYCYNKNQLKKAESNASDVCYKSKDKDIEKDDMAFYKLKFLEGAVRKFLAVGLFTLWSWLIVLTYLKFQVSFTSLQRWMIYGVLIVFSLVMVYFFWQVTVKLKRAMDQSNQRASYIKKIDQYQKVRLFFIFLLFVIYLLVANSQGWGDRTVFAQVVVSAYLSIDLMIVRTLRKYMEPQCDIIDFLKQIRFGFVLIVILLVAFNFLDGFTMSTNPINVTLCGIIVLYYVITYILKMYLFAKYGDKDVEGKNKRDGKENERKSIIYFWGVVVLIVFAVVMTRCGNDLHNLQLIPKTTSPVTLSEHYEKFENVKGSNQAIFYAAYGGGLKAHYWNLLVLDEIEKRDEMKNIVAMSGVSGGGMGITSHAIINYIEANDDEGRKLYRGALRSSNVLSLELGYYFGLDMVRNWLPSWSYPGNDRSYRSMNYYANLFDKEELVSVLSFDEVYRKIFENKYYPNVIINSTSPNNYYGVVAAIRKMDETVYSSEGNYYPSAVNLLDIKKGEEELTLSFLEAASTCNRFPFISPAADIETKGTFVDGGYYENSGLMSLLSYKDAIDDYCLSQDASFVAEQVKFVSVTNDKMNYVQSIVKDLIYADSLKETSLVLQSNNDYTGMRAVFTSGLNKDRSPEYFRSYIERYRKDITMSYIDLPYFIEEDYLKDYFDGCLEDKAYNEILMAIEESNDEIVKLLRDNTSYDLPKWGVMNPPTARILSRPVEIYMETMKKHSKVVEQLSKLN